MRCVVGRRKSLHMVPVRHSPSTRTSICGERREEMVSMSFIVEKVKRNLCKIEEIRN